MASSQAAIAGSMAPKVLVTVEPLKPYVDAIMQGAGQSESLLKPTQDPHTMTLSPVQARELAEADIVITPDASINPALARLFDQKKKSGAILIELTQLPGANPMTYAAENPWLAARKKEANADKEPEDQHTDTTPDPHLWLDPARMADIAGPLAARLAQFSPTNEKTFSYNAEKLAYHLRHDVDPAIRAILATRKQRDEVVGSKPTLPFVTYHAASQCFLTHYGVSGDNFITKVPDELMGARSIHDAQVRARAINIRCVISESDTAIAKRIAEVSNAELVVLNPEWTYSSDQVGVLPWTENDYDRMLAKVAMVFAHCL